MRFIANIAYFMVFGKPVIMYLGIMTILSFLITATIGLMNFKGSKLIPFRWHPRLALISIILAVLHGLLAISGYFL